MRGVRAGRCRARSTGWAAARAYLGADATARHAHNTCIATCALVRVCFEVNERQGKHRRVSSPSIVDVSRSRSRRSVFATLSVDGDAYGVTQRFPPSPCRRTSRAPPRYPLTRPSVARRDRRGATAASAAASPREPSPGTPRRPMMRPARLRLIRLRPPDASRCPPRSRSRCPFARPGSARPPTRRRSGAKSP